MFQMTVRKMNLTIIPRRPRWRALLVALPLSALCFFALGLSTRLARAQSEEEPLDDATDASRDVLDEEEGAEANEAAKEPAAKSAGGRAPERIEEAGDTTEADDETQAARGKRPTSAPDGVETSDSDEFDIRFYGYAALNVFHDSTQSFPSAISGNVLSRRGTYESQHSQLVVDARDSRFGLIVELPSVSGIDSLLVGELDFRGVRSTDDSELQSMTMGAVRMRHFYMDVRTPVVDVLAGQFHNLFGWVGRGFFPSTLAFLGLPGQLFNRQPQLRL
jgi:hypothetical protein